MDYSETTIARLRAGSVALFSFALSKLEGMGTNVYTGISGVALTALFLNRADVGIPLLERSAAAPPPAKTPACPTFLTSAEGAHATLCVMHRAAGNADAFAASFARVLAAAAAARRAPPKKCELMYGRAGCVQAVLFAAGYPASASATVAALPPEAAEVVRGLCVQMIENGLVTAAAARAAVSPEAAALLPPLLWEWESKLYIGYAHGGAGILSYLLLCRSLLPAEIVATVWGGVWSYLALGACPISSLRMAAADPTCRAAGGHLVQWCHGPAGMILLACTAARAAAADGDGAGAQRAAAAAAALAEPVAREGLLSKGVGLCHGAGGNGLALACAAAVLAPFDAAAAERCWRAACVFAECAAAVGLLHAGVLGGPFAGGEWHSTLSQLLTKPDVPASLFEGACGGAWLCEAVARGPPPAAAWDTWAMVPLS